MVVETLSCHVSALPTLGHTNRLKDVSLVFGYSASQSTCDDVSPGGLK